MGIETTWTEKEIKDIIREFISRYVDITLKDDTSISNNIDSLDLLELCMEIEDKFEYILKKVKNKIFMVNVQ